MIGLEIISLIIAGLGAITGVTSLIWHIFNSKSNVILERVYFTKANRHEHKVSIDARIQLRNKSNKSTTIESIDFIFGNFYIEIQSQKNLLLEANTSKTIEFTESISPKEFERLMEKKPVRLGVHITHTFGILERYGSTDFSTPWLTLT